MVLKYNKNVVFFQLTAFSRLSTKSSPSPSSWPPASESGSFAIIQFVTKYVAIMVVGEMH